MTTLWVGLLGWRLEGLFHVSDIRGGGDYTMGRVGELMVN